MKRDFASSVLSIEQRKCVLCVDTRCCRDNAQVYGLMADGWMSRRNLWFSQLKSHRLIFVFDFLILFFSLSMVHSHHQINRMLPRKDKKKRRTQQRKKSGENQKKSMALTVLRYAIHAWCLPLPAKIRLKYDWWLCVRRRTHHYTWNFNYSNFEYRWTHARFCQNAKWRCATSRRRRRRRRRTRQKWIENK